MVGTVTQKGNVSVVQQATKKRTLTDFFLKNSDKPEFHAMRGALGLLYMLLKAV
jgi:hypothetical protein